MNKRKKVVTRQTCPRTDCAEEGRGWEGSLKKVNIRCVFSEALPRDRESAQLRERKRKKKKNQRTAHVLFSASSTVFHFLLNLEMQHGTLRLVQVKSFLWIFELGGHADNLHAAVRMRKQNKIKKKHCVVVPSSLEAWGKMRRWGGCRCRCRLGRALVGAQQHLVLDGTLCAAELLLHQELFEPARSEGERLPPQLHQVGVLHPGLHEAVPRGGTSPETKNYPLNNNNDNNNSGKFYLWSTSQSP